MRSAVQPQTQPCPGRPLPRLREAAHGASEMNTQPRAIMNRKPRRAHIRRTITLTLLAVLALGQTTLSAFEQPAVQQLQTNDHIVIFGDSTTVGGLGPAGYVQLLIQALNEQVSPAADAGGRAEPACVDRLSGAAGQELDLSCRGDQRRRRRCRTQRNQRVGHVAGDEMRHGHGFMKTQPRKRWHVTGEFRIDGLGASWAVRGQGLGHAASGGDPGWREDGRGRQAKGGI